MTTAPNEGKSWFADCDAYEHYIGRWSKPISRLFVDWLSQPADLRWVDVGCGTGALSRTILDQCRPGRVIGIDPSDGFLGVAQTKIVDDRATFEIGDAQDLPLDDGIADIAVSGLVLNFVPDKNLALLEMRRVARPGGTIAAYVWDYAGDMQIIRYFWDAVCDLFPDATERHQAELFPICKPKALTDLFRAADLKAVETTALDSAAVFSDFDDYWSPFLRGQEPAGAQCAALSVGDRERLRQHLKDRLPVNVDGSIQLMTRAWAVRGTR